MATRVISNRFEPKPADSLQLFRDTFIVQPHPGAPDLPFAAEGRRATVFQIRNVGRELFALKVFKKLYRNSSLINASKNLTALERFEGMRAASRRVILPSHAAAQDCKALEYAMLMPWISGQTWADIMLNGSAKKYHLRESTAIHLCAAFLKVMQGLEQNGIAHTDISAGNVMVEANKIDVQLLDLEDIYFNGAAPPLHQNVGSAGYGHHCLMQGKTSWCAEGDRYATAILAAEMLILANSELARLGSEDGYFGKNHREQHGEEQYKKAEGWISTIAPEFAPVFKRAWLSESLDQCPHIFEISAAIESVAKRTPREEGKGLITFAESETTTVNERRRTGPLPKEKPLVEWVGGETAAASWLIGSPSTSTTTTRKESQSASPKGDKAPAITKQTAPSPESSKMKWFVWAIIIIIILLLIARAVIR